MSINYQSPLEWPSGWARKAKRHSSQFTVGLNPSVIDLEMELATMGATLPIVTSNLEFRRDGFIRARQNIADPGVALYFHFRGEPQVMACDEFREVWENIRAIFKTIQALRGIERWGGLGLSKKAFEGFKALPAGERPWWEVLEVLPGANDAAIREARNRLAQQYHPDRPEGNIELMKEVNRAYGLAMGRA